MIPTKSQNAKIAAERLSRQGILEINELVFNVSEVFFFLPLPFYGELLSDGYSKSSNRKKKDFPVSSLHLIHDSKGEPAVVPGRRLCSLKAASGELRSKLSSVVREKRK